MTNKCNKLHQLFKKIKRLRFPFDEKGIPLNGIYILFEKGELAHKTDRIVRIGTHTGDNQLRARVKQHFINENKDRSIFRKNIGRALLNKKKDPFLKYWDIDLTSRTAKEKYSKIIDSLKQRGVEREVTKYIQENFSFAVFTVFRRGKRLELEAKIISTVSLCNKCKASPNWLGLYSPKRKIRESGLWLTQELYKEPLSDKDYDGLSVFIE